MIVAGRRLHYAWVIVGITSLALLAANGSRAMPGVLIMPLEGEFGWGRAGISLAVTISFLCYGLGGPLAGSVIDRFGPRPVMLSGLGLMALGLTTMALMQELWQFYLLWGLLVGTGTGAAGSVLGATVAQRWFRSHQGLILGLFGAASSGGQLIILPTMMAVTVEAGWRTATLALAGVGVLVLAGAALLMRNGPADVGTAPYGETPAVKGGSGARADDGRVTTLREALHTRDYWLLAGSFFVCGFTANGMIGTHLIPHAVEHGFSEVAVAGAMGLMGSMNVIGTLASGWATDRFDNRRLLAMYYGFRATSLLFLPSILELPGLLMFAIVYGLDWVATVPATANLTAQLFGRRSLGTLFGWITFSHMVGGALAAYSGGFFRDLLGDYHLVFLSAAAMGFVGAALALRISPARRAAGGVERGSVEREGVRA